MSQVEATLDRSEEGWTGGHNPWLITVVVTLATFMEILDTSIANVALPQIAGNLGVSRHEGTWVLTSYLVANAVVLPLSGWLSNRLGRKRFYMTSVLLFSGASLCCGLSPTLGWLILFRVLQGLGGGGLVPVEQAILIDTFPATKRGMAIAVYGMTAVLAPAMGPTLGGFITDHFSWRWIFLINIPVGLLSFTLTARFLSDPPYLRRSRAQMGSIDWIALGLIALGLGTLEFVLERGQESDWFDSSIIVGCSIVAVTALLAFVVREWNHERPLVDLKLLARGNFAVANVLMLGLAFTSFAITVIMPQYLQAIMGYSAARSGLVLSPGGLLIFCCLPIAGRLASKTDPRLLLTGAFCVVGAAIVYTARTINVEMDFATGIQLRLMQCVGFGFLFVPVQMLAYAGLPKNKNNEAASLMSLSRNMGADIGIAFLVTLIYRQRQTHQVHLVSNATEFDASYRAAIRGFTRALVEAGYAEHEAARRAIAKVYDDVIAQAMQLAYVDALIGIAAVAGVMALLTWLARWPAPTIGDG
ncbi:MAG: DHA2 family efflux MFS transporter permease subunit [Polyangiaceae bacterium]